MGRTKELLVGIFIIFAIVVLILSLFFLGKIELRRDNYVIKVEFDTVNNLEIGTPVMLSGVKVGKVKKIYLNTNKVIVDMYINQNIKIRKGAKVSIVLKGIIGEQLVSIYNPVDDTKGYYQDGDRFVGENPVDLNTMVAKSYDIMNSVQTLSDKVDDMMSDNSTKEIMGNMKDASEKLNVLLDKTSETIEKTNKVLDKSARLLDKSQDGVEKSLKNINTLISTTQNFVQKTEKLLEAKDKEISQILADTSLVIRDIKDITSTGKDSTEQTLDNFLKLSQNLKEIAEKIDQEKLKTVQEDMLEITSEIKLMISSTKDAFGENNSKKLANTIKNTEEISQNLKEILDNDFQVVPEIEVDSDDDFYMNLNARFDNRNSNYYMEIGSDNINDDYGQANLLFGLTENRNDFSAGIIKGKAGFRYQHNFNKHYTGWAKYYDFDKSNILLNLEYNLDDSKIFMRYKIEDMFYLGAGYRF